MRKLKIGDKVRVVKVDEDHYDWMKIGLEGEIIEADEAEDDDVPYYVRYSTGKTWWMREDQIELVEPKGEEVVFEPDLAEKVAKLEERLEKLELLNPTKGVVFTPEQIEVIINLRK